MQPGASHDNVVGWGRVHDDKFDEEIIRRSRDNQRYYTRSRQSVTIVSHQSSILGHYLGLANIHTLQGALVHDIDFGACADEYPANLAIANLQG